MSAIRQDKPALRQRQWMKFSQYRFCVWLLIASVQGIHAAVLSAAGRATSNLVVVLQPDCTKADEWAATQLTNVLSQVTGSSIELLVNQTNAPMSGLIVGSGAMARSRFCRIDFDRFKPDEIVIQSQGNLVLLAGGGPRGSMYAVARYLQKACGVYWWTPWAATIPSKPGWQIKKINLRESPAFESRDMDWIHSLNSDWTVFNFLNSRMANLDDARGGAIRYNAFAHTFYDLVPPEKYYPIHPEWFSLVHGERLSMHGQLCLSNPHLKDFVVEQVKARLRSLGSQGVVSVSQNDCYGNCQCEECNRLDQGNPAGSLLCFVNDIAERIETEFPDAAIETLAYQYSRKPPKNVRPRANVILRLCAFECNFAVPFTHLSNAAFAEDVHEWSKICNRLYVWDYTTNFENYVQPFPNWFSMGPNLRFLKKNNVKGVFAEGNRQSYGGEMAELRAWVLGQLLWNPNQNDKALIKKFLCGYYGRKAARPICRYLREIQTMASNGNVACLSSTDQPFLSFDSMAKAERWWQKAEKASKNDPEKGKRVRLAHMAVQYVWLKQWDRFAAQYGVERIVGTVGKTKGQLAAEWLEMAKDPAVAGITHLDLYGQTPEDFMQRLNQSETATLGTE